MSKSPWKGIGDWAAEAERAEAEEREAAEKAAAAQPQPSFPSLKEAVTPANKQKKRTKMTLQEFTMQTSAHSSAASSDYSRGLTPDEMLRLPTGPKERTPDEMQYGRLGGGFSNYGTRPGSGGSGQARPRDYDGRRSYGFPDDDRRGGHPRVSEMNQPSRADGVDNWASAKRQTMPEYNQGQPRPGGRYGSLGGGGTPLAASRADEVDNWAAGKKTISLPHQQPRSSGFGSGFSRHESDRWSRNEQRPEDDRWTRNDQRIGLDSLKIDNEAIVKVDKPNPFGSARPREEVLAEKGLDYKKLDLEIEGKKRQQSVSGGSRPSSSQSSRPGSSQSSRSEMVAQGAGEAEVKQKPKVNPFGNAKPREVLLEEKGLDWKKIDLELEHRRIERRETEEERNLKEEIEHLKKQMQQESGDIQTNTGDLIRQRERDLELLVRQLDDKVRYSQKYERPGSGAGRGGGFNERPPSRPGAYDESRAGFHDRPPMTGPYESGYPERPRSRPGRYDDPRAVSSERPPSRGGAYDDPRAGYSDRPPSRPGYEDQRGNSRPAAYDEPRGVGYSQRPHAGGGYQDPRCGNYNERPRSRGTGNSWTRPGGDDRRNSYGAGGRGFLGSRETDGSGSRW